MESKIEEGMETTTTRKKQTNSGLKIDITSSSNQSIPPNRFKSQCVLPLTPILWISKTVKHPSSLSSVEDFILWTPPPITYHEIPGSSSSLSMMDALSVIENLLWLQNSLLFSPLHSQSTQGRRLIYYYCYHTTCVCCSFWHLWLSVHLMKMSGHWDIFRWGSCLSDEPIGHVVLHQPPPHPPNALIILYALLPEYTLR